MDSFGSREFDRSIGHRVRQERRLAGSSQAELAAALGVSPQSIESHERGEKRLTAARLEAATKALGVPISAFFYDDGARPRPSETAIDALERKPWLAIRRPLTLLSRRDFSQAAPIVKIWCETRGDLTEDARRAIRMGPLFHRTILARQRPRASGLVIEHFGWGIVILRPCEALLARGSAVEDQPDRPYREWVAETYAQTSWEGSLRLDSIRASIGTSASTTLRVRYDRVLMPWRARNDLLVMCLSLRRDLRVVA